jgi:hypothetical protein
MNRVIHGAALGWQLNPLIFRAIFSKPRPCPSAACPVLAFFPVNAVFVIRPPG